MQIFKQAWFGTIKKAVDSFFANKIQNQFFRIIFFGKKEKGVYTDICK